jgi:hypothetical protein
MCVYAKPRYFNAKGREELREGIASTIRKLSSKLTRKSSNASQNQATATKTNSHSPANPAANIPTTKSSLKSNSLIPMETEVVPFDAPDAANDPDDTMNDVLDTMDETETIPLGAPNSIDEPGIASSPPNPPSDDENRHSRIRSTLMALPQLFIKMHNEDEAETNNETADVGLTLNNDQQDVIADNEDDDLFEMLIAG